MPYGYPGMMPPPPQEQEARPSVPQASPGQIQPPPPPVAASPQAQSPMMMPPPQATSQQPSLISRILPALGSLAVAGGGMALGGDVGEAMGGLAQGFADQKLKLGTELRQQKFKQNEALLQQAHKAVMDTMGKDLSGFPNLAKLVDKYNTAITSQESDGNYISPKEASEIIALWTVAQGELSQANAQQEDDKTRRAGRVAGEVKRGEMVEDERFIFGGSPEEARGRLQQQGQQARNMAAPVSLGSTGIPDLPAGAADLQVSRESAAKMVMDHMTQTGIANRQNAQAASQFARQMAVMKEQFKQAEMRANAQGMQEILARATIAAFTPDPQSGQRLFPNEEQAFAFIKRMFGEFGSMMTPPPGSGQGKGRVLGELP